MSLIAAGFWLLFLPVLGGVFVYVVRALAEVQRQADGQKPANPAPPTAHGGQQQPTAQQQAAVQAVLQELLDELAKQSKQAKGGGSGQR